MKRQIILIVSIAVILVGCGQSNEHAIFRSGDMITIYWVCKRTQKSPTLNSSSKAHIIFTRGRGRRAG